MAVGEVNLFVIFKIEFEREASILTCSLHCCTSNNIIIGCENESVIKKNNKTISEQSPAIIINNY